MSLSDAIAWARAHDNRARAAAKRFGVPVEDVRAGLAKRKPGRPGSPTPAEIVPDRPAFDPAAMDPVEYWARELRTCEAMRDQCADQRGQREWTIQCRYARQALESARAEHAADEARKRAAEIEDPNELIDKILTLLPSICRSTPDRAAEVAAEIMDNLGGGGG